MSFSYFSALIRTFRMMLKCSGEKRHPCLVPDLTEKAPGFSLMLAIGLLYLSLSSWGSSLFLVY